MQWKSRNFRGECDEQLDSEACLNRQILNNSVKRKAMEDSCEGPRKLIHKVLRSQYFDTVTYKDIRNTSRNMHKAGSSQLLALPRDVEETHEALTAVQVLKGSKEQSSLVNDSDNNILKFSWKPNLHFLSSIDVLYVDGTFKSAPKFSHQLFTIHGLSNGLYVPLAFSYWPINVKVLWGCIQTYGISGCKIWCECFFQQFLCCLRNRNSQRSENSVARLWS